MSMIVEHLVVSINSNYVIQKVCYCFSFGLKFQWTCGITVSTVCH